MSGLVVAAACVIVKDTEGHQQYLYAGALVPDGLDKDDVKRLTDEGFLVGEKSKAAKEFDATDPESTSGPVEPRTSARKK
jgi:hypothetical protein